MIDSKKLSSLRLKYQESSDVLELIDEFANLKGYDLLKDNVPNGYIFFISYDDLFKYYNVCIVDKKYYEETGCIRDQHITHKIKHLLPDIIGGETQESVFEALEENSEVIRKAMLDAGFEEIPNPWE